MLNPNIAMQGRVVDPSQGIEALSRSVQYSQQKKTQDEQIKKQDAQQAKQNVLTDLQITQARDQIEQQGKTRSVTEAAENAVMYKNRAAAGDVAGVRNLALDNLNKLNEKRKTDPTINTVHTERFIAELDKDPANAMKLLDAEIDGYTQLGYLKAADKQETFAEVKDDKGNIIGQKSSLTGEVKSDPRTVAAKEPLTTIGKARKDYTDGNLTDLEYQVILKKESGLKSDEEINQLSLIEKNKAEAGRDNVKRQFEMDKLKNDIDQGKLKVEEGEVKTEKAERLKSSTLRLVNELLADPETIREITGPFDQSWMSPVLADVGLRAQTKIKQLQHILTADNLGLMVGVLSETDVKIIAAIAGGGIDLNGSDEAMIDELTRMRDALQGEGIQPESGINAQQTQQQLPAGVRSITKVK